MKIEIVNIDEHKVIKGIYQKDDISDVINEAELISRKVNPYSPSGELRSDEELLVKNFGGLLSERFISDILTAYSQNQNMNVEVLGSNWAEINSSLYQVDHAILVNNVKKTIETRSSFSYRTKCPERVITGAFSIIGPYVSLNKEREIHKDFYAFVFFCIEPMSLLDVLERNGISIYFAGGADINLLLTRNQKHSLNQRGAEYYIIKPILDSLDATEFLNKLFN